MAKDVAEVIYLASDHAGFELKQWLLSQLQPAGQTLSDLGCASTESCDYPDYAHMVAEKVSAQPGCVGILLCGTGTGMAMAANRHKGARAVSATETYTVEMARRHNDANVLCLGQRLVGKGLAWRLVQAFLETPFEGGRHQSRVQKI